MDSIAIGWSQPTTTQVGSLPKPHRSRYQSTRRIQPVKKEQSGDKNTENIGMTVRSQKSILDRSDFGVPSTSNLFEKTVITDAFEDKLLKINNKRLCSVRAAIVTFIIILVLIVAAAIAVGIVFASLNSKNSSREEEEEEELEGQQQTPIKAHVGYTRFLNRKTSRSKLLSVSTVSTTVVVSSISMGSGVGPPCTSYTSINDPTRNVNVGGNGGSCDNGSPFNTSNGGLWVRFIGSGGTIIPLTPPGANHCGAFLATWFNDTLPISVNGMVNGTVCANADTDNECLLETDVSVIFCSGSYYVYFLPPLSICNSRYCTT